MFLLSGDRPAGIVTQSRKKARALGLDRALPLVADPGLIVRAIVKRSPSASYVHKLSWDAVDRPHYAYCTYQAALQARALGLTGISVIELGVAGGNGLLTLEKTAEEVARVVGIDISVIGFDAGSGMPEPIDHRDLPYVWQKGFFPMDVSALRDRLQSAHLIVGDVADTIPAFVAAAAHSPIGFVAFDLDYYSSTVEALALLDAPEALRLPRMFCYFDDIIGDDWELHSHHSGELLAIREFNDRHDTVKIDPVNGLRHKRRIPAKWNDQIYVAHDFAHPLYETHIHPSEWDLGLSE